MVLFLWRSLTDAEAFVLHLGQEKSLSNTGRPGGVKCSASVSPAPAVSDARTVGAQTEGLMGAEEILIQTLSSVWEAEYRKR